MSNITVFAQLPPGLNPMSLFDQLVQFGPNAQIPSNSLAGTLGCSQRQFRAALAAGGYLSIVSIAIPPDPNDPINIQWSCGLLVLTKDTLWNAAQAALIAQFGAFTDAQMNAVLAVAQALPF